MIVSNFVSLYKGDVTQGGKDGKEVSELSLVSALKIRLDASKEEVKAAKCAIRCQEGYRTLGDVTITFGGSTSNFWKVCADNNYENAETAKQLGNWSTKLVIPEETIIRDSNYVFWVKAGCSANETPQDDDSVYIDVDGVVVNEEDYNLYLEELAEEQGTEP